MVLGVGTERILHDGLGSAVGRVDGLSGASSFYRYDAWGGLLDGTVPTRGDPSLAYAGQHWDSDAGLSYAQQRWYDPGVGRFLSEDPLFGDVANPNSLMAWGYANGNPLRWTDPTGEFVPVVILAGIIAWEALTIHEELRTGKGLIESNDALQERAMRHFEREGASVAQQSGLVEGLTVAAGGQFSTGAFFALPNLVLHPIETAKGILRLPVDVLQAGYGALTTTGDARLAKIGKLSGALGGLVALIAGGAQARGWTGPRMAELTRLPSRAVKADLWQGTRMAVPELLAEQQQAGIRQTVLRNLGANRRAIEKVDLSRLVARERMVDAGGATRAVEGATAPVGRLGIPMTVPRGTNAPTAIGGRRYTGHALDQMQGRGLTPSVVEDTITNGARSAGREGATVFQTNQARVILNPDGSVKTVMPFSP
jgi:RHS repeat-associated protein